eukprot:CAMPEP_0119353370 /NCGR_PEP_ID=MMETSP1334-20130426/2531_1 /TAXON_ID=127549 /ORGANISM="Calcidiscus leptoporus, Strain RCC1130" /LENGTH=192 /DNA_ID=CAMNT_0007366637 /DNA_START=155 /DNA_END=733 /DNA_ORIENTATION=+
MMLLCGSRAMTMSHCVTCNGQVTTATPCLDVSRVQSRTSNAVGRMLALRGGDMKLLVDEEDFQEALAIAGSELVVVDFFAEWCKPCKRIAPLLHSLSERPHMRGKVQFYQVDVDQSRELASKCRVQKMPTILFYKNGKQVHRIVGADLPGIKDFVARATMPIMLRILKSNFVIIGALAMYLSVPWGHVLAHV